MLFADFPRVRLDRCRQPISLAPTLREVPEESEADGCSYASQQPASFSFQQSTTGSILGKSLVRALPKAAHTFFGKNCVVRVLRKIRKLHMHYANDTYTCYYTTP